MEGYYGTVPSVDHIVHFGRTLKDLNGDNVRNIFLWAARSALTDGPSTGKQKSALWRFFKQKTKAGK